MSVLRFKSIQQGAVRADKGRALIKAKNLGVKYVVGSKREDVQSCAFNRLLRREKREEFWALKGVNFAGYAGDILGIIGFNGTGKTTLCRVISGLLRPDMGEIQVDGKISALLSLGTGFNYTLSGRENVLLNGLMLGFSKRYIKDLMPEIVAFSGLEDFIDEPLKSYSSGMKSRLGFSIAAMIEPEVLILDEALNAGDLEFSEKAGRKLQQIISQSKIVIVVTHQMGFVEKYCTRGLWIDEGQVRASGYPHEVVKLYKEAAKQRRKKVKPINLQKTEPKTGTPDVVTVRNLGLKYFLSAKKGSDMGRGGEQRRVWGRRKKAFWPLKNVNFAVDEGEVVGIIGRNGAGKTTLCRVLSEILKPDRGEVFVDGKITALLTFGAGFNIQLTGKDNVYLNGLMLGIPKKELEDVYFDIVQFSGLGKFMEQTVKNYSSGMRSRLGFSIAAMIRPDVFIIDEVLNAGDISFYEKASSKIQELMANAKAVIVVTHNMAFIETICTRALWLDNGIVKFDGSPKEAVEMYSQSIKH